MKTAEVKVPGRGPETRTRFHLSRSLARWEIRSQHVDVPGRRRTSLRLGSKTSMKSCVVPDQEDTRATQGCR